MGRGHYFSSKKGIPFIHLLPEKTTIQSGVLYRARRLSCSIGPDVIPRSRFFAPRPYRDRPSSRLCGRRITVQFQNGNTKD